MLNFLFGLLFAAVVVFFLTYFALFIPSMRALFHRFRIFRYFTVTHPRRHGEHNSLIAAGSMAAAVPTPGQIVSYDFRNSPASRDALSPTSISMLAARSTDNRAGVVRVVSWNIEYGYCLAAILEELRRLDADIICLQECDSFRDVPASVAVDCVAYLARQLGMCAVWAGNHAYGTNATPVSGIWGCAILSKFDLIESEYVHLEFLENYPRSAIGAICRTPLGDLCVYSLHLEVCCGLSTRLEQLDQIARHWQRYYSSKVRPVIMCGDFNSIGHGLIRLSPFHCTDDNRFAQLGQTEAQMMHTALGSHSILRDFFDPFDKSRDVTMSLSFMEAKLDWTLMRHCQCVASECQPVHAHGQSDHGWCSVDVVPSG